MCRASVRCVPGPHTGAGVSCCAPPWACSVSNQSDTRMVSRKFRSLRRDEFCIAVPSAKKKNHVLKLLVDQVQVQMRDDAVRAKCRN